jgi:hypothetical protein
MGFNHDVRLWYIGATSWESADASRQSSYTHIAKVTTSPLPDAGPAAPKKSTDQ